MPIETICQTCGRRLRVADEYAGKKARCPQCQTIFIVPGQPVPASTGQTDTAPGPESGGERWQVRTPDGQSYGPVSKSELDRWVAEGRVPAEAGVLAESVGVWYPASELYAQLRHSGPLSAASNPFADRPDAPAGFQTVTTPGFQRPHRGILILLLGLLSWVICPIFAPFAWIMGQADLRDMRRSQMDPSGMTLTQIGMVLGVVSTILCLLIVALMCLGVIL